MPSDSHSGVVAYLDASALVKLVIAEPESAALTSEIARWSRRATSELSVTEVLRAVGRTLPHARAQALDVLGKVPLAPLTRSTLMRAADLEPAGLRSLDAIHLATALELGQPVGTLFTYDQRLARAAAALGVGVAAPGA